MQSNKFLKIARNIAERDKALFDTLMEFEKTKKIRTKTRLNFTIDKSLASRFKNFCREKGFNMSAKIEQAIGNLIEKGQ
jgi:hypothetical protein|tara:strand:- start:54 stop:290 length:237 start_codon:yes stop_codon:yes gene_type:complete